MSLSFVENSVRYCSLMLLLVGVAFPQSVSNGPALANDLVRAVVANELKAQDSNESRWIYHVERQEQGKKKGKEVVQTRQGSLDRLLSVDGHPLSPAQELEETSRIQNLVRNSAEQQRIEQARKKDAEQCKGFFKMIPDAFIFTYVGGEGNLIKLNYRANPAFQPPSREARVFHALEGEMWVHRTQRRLVRMRGNLIADVKFAGGLLGHLQKGGHFDVQQQELSPGRWDVTCLDVDIQGKALLFKTIAIQQKECRTNFRAVPRTLTLAEGADMLTRQVMLAANR